MHATINFDLPEDEVELRVALDGMEHIVAIHNFQERLRSLNKYGHGFESTEQAITSLYNDYCELMSKFL